MNWHEQYIIILLLWIGWSLVSSLCLAWLWLFGTFRSANLFNLGVVWNAKALVFFFRVATIGYFSYVVISIRCSLVAIPASAAALLWDRIYLSSFSSKLASLQRIAAIRDGVNSAAISCSSIASKVSIATVWYWVDRTDESNDSTRTTCIAAFENAFNLGKIWSISATIFGIARMKNVPNSGISACTTVCTRVFDKVDRSTEARIVSKATAFVLANFAREIATGASANAAIIPACVSTRLRCTVDHSFNTVDIFHTRT